MFGLNYIKWYIRKKVEEDFICEDYCPYCRQKCRMFKIFECSRHHFRCLACNGLVYKANIPIDKIDRNMHAHPTSQELHDYAEIKAREAE